MKNPSNNYPCSRCSGSGQIRGFSHVLGGVCFKCHGTGVQASKPNTSANWAVIGTSPKTEELTHCYNVRAPTAAKAVKKARVISQRASDEWKEDHDLTDAFAVPQDEFLSEDQYRVLRIWE